MSKKDQDFNIPPVSTLIGSTLPNFFRVLIMGKPDLRYYPKLLLSLFVVLLSTPFQIFEYFYFRKKIKNFKFKKAPIFIVGHWRSGTTLLHNLLCQDPNHGFLTTYQSVFPNNLKSKWIFKTFMRINIPETRPADNVKLSADYPQEEEFALANMTINSFYHFFYFPQKNDELYQKYVRFDGGEKAVYFQKYQELLAKASLNTDKDRVIIKNPVNTAKIPWLLQMYPDAKFIHIHRNPVITYLSTVKFYLSLLPSTCLQAYSEQFIRGKIIENYQNIMGDFFKSKSLIPSENFIDIRFEDFEKNPLGHLEEIYKQFGLGTWDETKKSIEKYLSSQKYYQKNNHKISRSELENIENTWGFAMDKLGYTVPENIQIH